MKEYFIVENGERKGAFSLKDLKYKMVHPDTLIWREGWSDWRRAKEAVSEVPEIDLIINDDSSGQQVQEPIRQHLVKVEEPQSLAEQKEKEKNEPSGISLFYGFIGEHLDILVEKNKHKIGSDFFFTNLHKIRNFYKGLSLIRQKSMTFFVSCSLVFLITLILTFSIIDGFAYMVFFATYAALYGLNFIDKPINSITTTIIFAVTGWLPKMVRSVLSGIIKFVIYTVLVVFTVEFLGFIYLAYRAIIALINPQKLPSFIESHS